MKFFVSSTSKDLGAIRNGLSDYLKRLGCEVEVQEAFHTEYKTVHELLKGKIQSCDAVICLIGNVYGHGPTNQNRVPPRSFTQLEYYIALELNRPVYLFFPRNDCPLDGIGTDSEQESQFQQQYVAQLRQSKQIWYEFSNQCELNQSVATAIPDLTNLVRLSDSHRTIRQQMPTPLARLFSEYINLGNSELAFLAGDTLRFLALLAAHDAMLHRHFGVDRAERLDEIDLLKTEMEMQDWQLLLELSTPENGQRFIPQLAAFTRRHDKHLSRLFDALNALQNSFLGTHRAVNKAGIVTEELRQSILGLYDTLEFLLQYVVVVIRDCDSSTGTLAIEVHCGDRPKPKEVETSDDAPALQQGDVFLLSLDRRQAIRLGPAFCFQSTATLNDLWGLMQLTLDGESQTGELRLAPFSNQEGTTISIVPSDVWTNHSGTLGPECYPFSNIPEGWRSSGLWESVNVARSRAKPVSFRLMTDKSWESLHRFVSPESVSDRLLGNRFRVLGESIHWGKNASIYSAVEQTATGTPTQHAVHLLRDELLARPEVREWFASRALLWKKLNHSQVLRLDEHCEAQPDRARPFLATEFIPDRRTLASDMANGRRFSEHEILEILRLAAEVCLCAHEQRMRIVSLPLRHFLVGADEKLWLTGFDTLVESEVAKWAKQQTPLDHFRLATKDAALLAPELCHPSEHLAETVDIHALGVLLSQLRGQELTHRDLLPMSQWGDWMECLRFHCLAGTPALRVQSVRQFLRLLDEGRQGFTPEGYAATAVESKTSPDGHVLSAGKYAVTNALYHDYCLDGRRRQLPLHLRHWTDVESKYWRLAGPWCPVVFVHLDDAVDFARWLNRKTSLTWRVPNESQWRQLATAGDERKYPWGNETPHLELANYGSCHHGTTVVGAFEKGISASGCFDLAGNVWEWCTDKLFDGAPKRVLKGGAYDYDADSLCVASQQSSVVLTRAPHIGFRLISQGTL